MRRQNRKRSIAASALVKDTAVAMRAHWQGGLLWNVRRTIRVDLDPASMSSDHGVAGDGVAGATRTRGPMDTPRKCSVRGMADQESWAMPWDYEDGPPHRSTDENGRTACSRALLEPAATYAPSSCLDARTPGAIIENVIRQ